MENQPTPTPEPVRPVEYVTLPADDYRTMVTAAFTPVIPVTAGQRAGRTAETVAGFAGFGLLVAGVGWVGVKALDYIEERRLQRELRREQAKQARKQETGSTPSA